MSRPLIRKSPFGHFGSDTHGAALVEFGMLLPILLLFFAVIMEGSRTFWGYQATISGVRDATRYLARVAPHNICSTGGSLDGYTSTVETIVTKSASGDSFYPSSIAINSVTPSLACVAGTYRNNPAPIATVTAEISIAFPFRAIFTLVGGTLSDVTTTIADSSRIYGA